MTQSKTQSEPPERRTNNVFLVGQDSRGHWVVQDQRGLCGGLFADRSKAIKFAMDETGRQPQAIVMVSGIVELDMSQTPGGQRKHDGHRVRQHRPESIAFPNTPLSDLPLRLAM